MIQMRNHRLWAFAMAACLVFTPIGLHALTSLSRTDPDPMFNSLDPQTFLYTQEKLKLSEPELSKRIKDSIGLSISPFGQNAFSGRNLDCQKVPLGSLWGNWGMIALMYGGIPAGKTMAPSLQVALANLFPGVVPGTLNDGTKIDKAQQFGYFSVPLKYKKRGVRFDFEANIIGGFGLQFQTGVVSMSQTVTAFQDLTCDAPTGCSTIEFSDETVKQQFKDNTEKYLMRELKTIAKEMQLDICDFSEVSIEEVRLSLFWRNGYDLNNNEEGWPHFLLIPFFEIGGSASPGAITNPNRSGFNRQFATPFGNNGHPAAGFRAGINIDFIESIEIGAAVGTTYFFKKNFDNFRLPTSEFQTTIFPFRTDVTVQPGINWDFTAKISAYHFLDKLSGFFQYVQLEHLKDDVTLRKCDDSSVFMPQLYEKLTYFKVKLANVALNYDISPNIGLGVLWQAPLSQTNAYKSTTILFSFNATF